MRTSSPVGRLVDLMKSVMRPSVYNITAGCAQHVTHTPLLGACADTLQTRLLAGASLSPPSAPALTLPLFPPFP